MKIAPGLIAASTIEQPPLQGSQYPDISNPYILFTVLGGTFFTLFKMLLDREQRRLDKSLELLNDSNKAQIEAMRRQLEESADNYQKIIDKLLDCDNK